jgi:hypothetical protein
MMPVDRSNKFTSTVVAVGLVFAGLTAAQAQGQGQAQGLAQSIYSVEDGGLCVSVRGALDAFSPLVLARCNGRAAQLFRRDARTGKVHLHGRPELCIAGDFQPGDTNSSGLTVKPCNENNEDRWATNTAGNQFRTRFGTLGEFCWNAQRMDAGQQLDARRCTGRPNQQFVFNDADSGANAAPVATPNPASQNPAGSASCPRGEAPLRVTGLCPAEAAEAFLSQPKTKAYREKNCRWVVNETAMPGNEVLLYLAQRCGNQTATLALSGDPRAPELVSRTSTFGDDVKLRGFPVDPADSNRTINRIARAAIQDPGRARQCAAQEDSNGRIVVNLPARVLKQLAEQGPTGGECGEFGASDDASHWRVFGGMAWYINLGQDAWQSIDTDNITLLQRAPRGDGLNGWRVKYESSAGAAPVTPPQPAPAAPPVQRPAQNAQAGLPQAHRIRFAQAGVWNVYRITLGPSDRVTRGCVAESNHETVSNLRFATDGRLAIIEFRDGSDIRSYPPRFDVQIGFGATNRMRTYQAEVNYDDGVTPWIRVTERADADVGLERASQISFRTPRGLTVIPMMDAQLLWPQFARCISRTG